MRKSTWILLAGLILAAGPAGAEQHVVVGTGPVAGTYYPAGGALCRQVNLAAERHGLRCLVESTAGSEDNLRRLRAGQLDFALLQSDWQYYAGRDGTEESSEGEDENSGPTSDLRAVVSLHAQPFTLLARPESGIVALRDMEDKRINLGPEASAMRKANMALIEALGWDEDDFAELAALPPEELADALCGGIVDALLMPAGHPNGVIGAATDRCGARLVPVEGPSVEVLLAAWPFYAPATIPGGLYLGNRKAVPAFGLRATLVSSVRTPEETVYQVVRSLFEGLDAFRQQHPALAALDPQEMVNRANTLALHEGALRYYREKGWKEP